MQNLTLVKTCSRTIEAALDLLGGRVSKYSKNYQYWSSPETRVLLTISDDWANSSNGQLSIMSAANVLCRLSPIVTHMEIFLGRSTPILQRMPLIDSMSLEGALRQLITDISPLCHVSFVAQPRNDYDVVLSIGSTMLRHQFKVTIYSDGWLTYISSGEDREVHPSKNVNPIGAYTAALLGCIEVFKLTFRKKTYTLFPGEAESCFALQRMRQLTGKLKFSTLDYSVNSTYSPNPQLPAILNIGAPCLVGLGAIGEALVYTLDSLPIEGSICLVDPDEVRWSNLNRYICTTRGDAEANTRKVEVVKRLLEANQPRSKVLPFSISYDDFRKIAQSKDYDLIISAVDNYETRQLIQRDLPKAILNAGTLESMYSISRVDLGRSQCLICSDSKGELNLISTIANLTGIPTDEVERLRRTNAIFDEEHLRKLLYTKGNTSFPIPTPGTRFSDWLHEHKADMGLAKCPELNIPIPLTNILAGILLAGEVIKDKCFYEYRLNSQFDHDTFCLPMSELHRLVPPATECPFCSDKDVQTEFHDKHFRLIE